MTFINFLRCPLSSFRFPSLPPSAHVLSLIHSLSLTNFLSPSLPSSLSPSRAVESVDVDKGRYGLSVLQQLNGGIEGTIRPEGHTAEEVGAGARVGASEAVLLFRNSMCCWCRRTCGGVRGRVKGHVLLRNNVWGRQRPCKGSCAVTKYSTSSALSAHAKLHTGHIRGHHRHAGAIQSAQTS